MKIIEDLKSFSLNEKIVVGGTVILIFAIFIRSYFYLTEPFSPFPFGGKTLDDFKAKIKSFKEKSQAMLHRAMPSTSRRPTATAPVPVEGYQLFRNNENELTLCPAKIEQFTTIDEQIAETNDWGKEKTRNTLNNINIRNLPQTSEEISPYDLDVADPIAYSFMVHPPRVIKKDPLAMQADPFRGDIPLTIYPDVPLVGKSQYGRSSQRFDTLFSDGFDKLHKKYTSLPINTYEKEANFNIPQYVAQQGINM